MKHENRSVRDQRPHRLRSLCAGFLSVTLMTGSLVGCDGGEDPLADDQQREAFAAMSGEELYLGIFLGQGEAARLVPEVHEDADLVEQVRDPKEVLDALRSAKAEREARGDEAGARLVQSTIDAVESGLAEDRLVDGVVLSESVASMFVLQLDKKDPTFFDRFADDLHSGDPRRVDRALEEGVRLSQSVAEELAINSEVMQPRAGVALAVVAAVVAAVALYAFVVVAEGFWVVLYEEARNGGSRLFRDELVARVTDACASR